MMFVYCAGADLDPLVSNNTLTQQSVQQPWLTRSIDNNYYADYSNTNV